MSVRARPPVLVKSLQNSKNTAHKGEAPVFAPGLFTATVLQRVSGGLLRERGRHCLACWGAHESRYRAGASCVPGMPREQHPSRALEVGSRKARSRATAQVSARCPLLPRLSHVGTFHGKRGRDLAGALRRCARRGLSLCPFPRRAPRAPNLATVATVQPDLCHRFLVLRFLWKHTRRASVHS